MKASVFELSIPACVDAAELAGVLARPEFLGAWEEDGSVVLYWNEKRAEILQQVRSAVSVLGVELPEGSIRFQSVLAQDWNAKWVASVRPSALAAELVFARVGPPWTCRKMEWN
jgi:hypothetical protein